VSKVRTVSVNDRVLCDIVILGQMTFGGIYMQNPWKILYIYRASCATCGWQVLV